MTESLSPELEPGTIVYGKAGVFYADRPAVGTVLNAVAPNCVHVQLSDGDRAVVPVSSVTPTDRKDH